MIVYYYLCAAQGQTHSSRSWLGPFQSHRNRRSKIFAEKHLLFGSQHSRRTLDSSSKLRKDVKRSVINGIDRTFLLLFFPIYLITLPAISNLVPIMTHNGHESMHEIK